MNVLNKFEVLDSKFILEQLRALFSTLTIRKFRRCIMLAFRQRTPTTTSDQDVIKLCIARCDLVVETSPFIKCAYSHLNSIDG